MSDTVYGAGAPAVSSMSGGYVTRSGSNLLFAPDASNLVYTYEDSLWQTRVIPDAGITVACTGLSATTLYYLYVYDNGGTLTLDLSTTAPTTQNGINVKTGDTSRLMIARCRTNGAGDVVTHNEDAAWQLVTNEFNKRLIHLYVREATNTWTYASTTFRYARGSSSNAILFISDGKNAIEAETVQMGQQNASGHRPIPGIGVDRSNGQDATLIAYPGHQTNSQLMHVQAKYGGILSAGFHYIAWIEACQSTTTITFYGDAGAPTVLQSGMRASIMA
jgi:hypothetical protein